MHKCAVCLIIKNESQYLIEWLEHYRNLGFSHFFIYNNSSDVSIKDYFFSIDYQDYNDVTIIDWRDENVASQQRAYLHCCQNQQEFDYILFVDTDEFLELHKAFNSIQEWIKITEDMLGSFDALGIYWKFYGENFETRQSIDKYKHYHKNGHIKSMVNPKKVLYWPDPHKCVLQPNSVYINEFGDTITSPIGEHTSKSIWIKHIYCRSLEEWKEKMTRGSGDKVQRERKLEDWYE